MCRILLSEHPAVHARGTRRTFSRLGLWVALFPLFAAANPFYVATNGSDGWSGLLSAPTPTRSDGPFRTLPRAQLAVREVQAVAPTGTVRVLIRAGTYALEAPLVFDARDARPAGSLTWWESFPGEMPILSGGRRITGWQPQPGASNLWAATVPADAGGYWWFNQLYVNDRRATRARQPNAGEDDLIVTVVSDGGRRLQFDRGWGGENLTGTTAELFMYHEWSCSRAAVLESGVNEVVAPAPVGVVDHAATTARLGDRVFLEHAFSFLDQPGEWFLERASGKLYLMVADGQDPNNMNVVAPHLEQILAVRGTWDAPVRGVCIRGLSLEHSLWLLPAIGLPEAQAGHYLPSWFKFTTYVPPVAVELSYAEDCRVERCRVRHTGADGIGIGAGTRGNAIDGCEITDTGVNGISLGWRGGIHPDRSIFTLGAEWPTVTDIPASNRIVDCDVSDAGRYLDEDPLRRLKRVCTDPVRRRRALIPGEITKLLETCLPERRLLYETALCTGLRANELRNVTPAHLDDERSGIRLEAAWTKNRLDGFQPVPRWLMNRLRAGSEALGPTSPIFSLQKTHPARMIQTDLVRAGIPPEIPGEGKIDFHSLRVTYCSMLDYSGASAKENQQLARHSTPALTMNVYVRTQVDRVRGVVESLGEIVNPAAPPYRRLTEETPPLRLLSNAG